MNRSTRRQWLGQAVAAGAAVAVGGLAAGPLRAIEPLTRVNKGRLKLGLAAYSFGKFFKPDAPAGKAMTMEKFIDYCGNLNLDGAELTSYYFPATIDAAYIAGLKRYAHIAGMELSGGAVGNDFCTPDEKKLETELASVKLWIDRYAEMGVPVIRVFSGNLHKGDSEEKAIERCIPWLQKACEHAGRRGVLLGLENHGFSMRMGAMMKIVKAVQSPWLGVNLDSGNFRDVADPYAAMEELAPYSVNVQVKIETNRANKNEKADFKRIIQLLRRTGYSGYVVLEFEGKGDPFQEIPGHVQELRAALGA